MTTIADNVSAATFAELRRMQGVTTLAPKRDNSRLLAMAAGRDGSPFTRDSSGRLRINGRFATVK